VYDLLCCWFGSSSVVAGDGQTSATACFFPTLRAGAVWALFPHTTVAAPPPWRDKCCRTRRRRMVGGGRLGVRSRRRLPPAVPQTACRACFSHSTDLRLLVPGAGDRAPNCTLRANSVAPAGWTTSTPTPNMRGQTIPNYRHACAGVPPWAGPGSGTPLNPATPFDIPAPSTFLPHHRLYQPLPPPPAFIPLLYSRLASYLPLSLRTWRTALVQ